MRKTYLLLVAWLFLATPALAQTQATPINGWTQGSAVLGAWVTKTVPARVPRIGCVFFEFDDEFGASGIGQTYFFANSDTKVCSSHDVTGTSGAMVWELNYCPTALPPSPNVCEELIPATEIGIDDCEGVTRGWHMINVTTKAGVDEDAVISACGY